MGFYNSSTTELDESLKDLPEQREELLIDMGNLERISLHSLPTHVRLLWSHPGSGLGFEIYEYCPVRIPQFWDPAPDIAHQQAGIPISTLHFVPSAWCSYLHGS